MPTGPRTLVESLARAAAWQDQGLRILDRHGDAEWFSWDHVRQRALRVAGGLQALGVRPGECIAIVFPTTAGFFDAYFGVLLAGAVPVPLYPPVRLGRLDEYHARTSRMIRVVSARLVLADPGVRRILGETMRVARPALGCLRLDDLPAGEAEPVRVDAKDLALVQFSSGTTREPKAVALSHRALAAQAEMLNGFWPDNIGGSGPDGERPRDSGLSWLPLYHDMGLIGCVLTALVRPGTLTLMPPETFVARPSAWLQAISRYRATISPAPNFAYGLCVTRIRDEEMEGVDLSSWRIALNGAEQAVPDVMRAFNQRFARWGLSPAALTPVYGLSEASLAVTFSAIHEPFVARRFDREFLSRAGVARESEGGREIASVGRPVPGVELRVMGTGGEPLSEGLVGVVECRGPSTMEGYVGQADATARVLRDGWLDTGDLGFLWQGELFLSGRAKDMLLLRGRNYAPEEVERVVDALPGVRTGCVVAVTYLPEGVDGERLLVFVEARRDLSPSLFPDLERRCADCIVAALGLSPERVVVLAPGTLPRTSSGKLRRQEALRQFLADELTAPAAVTPLRLATAITRSSLAFLRARWRGGEGD